MITVQPAIRSQPAPHDDIRKLAAAYITMDRQRKRAVVIELTKSRSQPNQAHCIAAPSPPPVMAQNQPSTSTVFE
jgi:hypothetical protein